MSGPPIHKLLEPCIQRFLASEFEGVELNKRIKAIIDEQSQSLTTQINFSTLLNKLVSSSLDLLNYNDIKEPIKFKVAGLTIFDCLLEVNDEIMPQRRIEIINHVSKLLENDKLPIDILKLASLSIGHFARIASTTEIEFVQNFSFPLALKLLSDTRSDIHRYAGSLILTQLAVNSPALIFAERKLLFKVIWNIVCDKNEIVRDASAETLESALHLISQREAMSEYINTALKTIISSFSNSSSPSEKIVGSMIILNIIISGAISISDLHNTIRAQGIQIQELIWKILQKRDSKDQNVRIKILEIIPNLAGAFQSAFVQTNSFVNTNFLAYSCKHLIDMINTKRDRTLAYMSLGKLFLTMNNHMRQSNQMNEIYSSICNGFKDPFCTSALKCLGIIINSTPLIRRHVDNKFIDLMFRGGLTVDLVDALKITIKNIPTIRNHAQYQLRTHVVAKLNHYTVMIDELRERVANPIRRGSVFASSILNNQSTKPSLASAFFGNSNKADIVQPNNNTISNVNASENEIIFILQILMNSDFFPKMKERQAFSSDKQAERVIVIEEDQSLYLLAIIRDSVLRFLDDFNPDVRGTAAQTCCAVLDNIVMAIDSSSNDFKYLYQIVDRLLIAGVGDDSKDIRLKIFTYMTPSLDHIVALTENVHCIIEALNDECLEVRAAAITILSRLAHFDSLHIMPVVRLTMKRLINLLLNTKDRLVKKESVLLLQALVRGSDSLIIPYVQQVMASLMSLLNDTSDDVVVASLSTVGELAVASPESVREHLDELAPRLINALNDEASVAKREIAVIAMGKLVSSLTMVTDEPYKKYSGLFAGLVRAIQSVEDSSDELKLQAIKTVGLLGIVDATVYQHHLVSHAGVIDTFSSQIDYVEDSVVDDDELANQAEKKGEKGLSKIERSYFSVVMRSLMSVLRDSNLSAHHQTAVGIAIRTYRILGTQASSQLKEVIDGIVFRLYQTDTSNNLKETLLDHLISLIHIMGKLMKTFSEIMIKIINDFFENHLQLCLDIVESLAYSFSSPDFNFVLRGVLPLFVKIIEEEVNSDIDNIIDNNGSIDASKALIKSSSGSSNIRGSLTANQSMKFISFLKVAKIFQKLVNISSYLGEYRREIIPYIIKILDCQHISFELRKEALITVLHLSNDADLQEFASRIIHPLMRWINIADSAVQSVSLTALSCLLCRLGTGYLPYVIPVRRKLRSLPSSRDGTKSAKLEEYESLVSRLLKQRPLPPDPSDKNEISVKFDDRIKSREASAKPLEPTFQLGIQALETAWALSDRNSSSDLVEWMRRLSIELIRQSPSPIIRSCATLAKVYRPLAEELFNSSFNSLWDDMFGPNTHELIIDISLINGIEMALNSQQIPNNIMIALLNLAEFMEMQDKRLPIDVRLLARQAQAANMFAKSLFFREIEFYSKNVTPCIECIDALITVNNQLGLSDRAVGVLQYLKATYPDISIEPSWLEKLCRWEDAQSSYKLQSTACSELFPNDSPTQHEKWMASELGAMRCLNALGEYEELEACAIKLKNQIKTSTDDIDESNVWSTSVELRRLGANAAWMLGKWDSMESFLEGEVKSVDHKNVSLEENISFYQAVLAIHNKEYEKALSVISETRNSLSNSISSLLSESFSRAFRAMVTMQVLSEMEEVVDYKQTVEKVNIDLEALKNSNLDNSDFLMIKSRSGEKRQIGKVDLVAKKNNLIRKWTGRLKWAPKEVDVYRQILAIHSLVAEPMEDLDSWLELIALCRKEGMFSLCENTLRKLGAPISKEDNSTTFLAGISSSDVTSTGKGRVNNRVYFSTYKYLWSTGEKNKALTELSSFLKSLPANNLSLESKTFRVKCLLKKADWMRELNEGDVKEILATLMEARELATDHYSVWHAWAVANYDQLKKVDTTETKSSANSNNTQSKITNLFPLTKHENVPIINPQRAGLSKQNYQTPKRFSISSGSASLVNLLSIQQVDSVTSHVVEAIKGFVRSIILGQGQPVANVLQDTLRLLTLWFSYGTKKGVFNILELELLKVSPENWLSVVPQLIARIHIKSPEISGLLRTLLTKVAAMHPQALVCPISVALNTNDSQQKLVATDVLHEMRKLCSQLVEEATMVSRELMRVAITPHELWYDGLEQAAQLYMDNKDIQGMMTVLTDLHEAMNDTLSHNDSKIIEGFSESIGKIGRSTLRDISFRHSYSKSLSEAQEWLEMFRISGLTTDLHQAWEVYQQIFKRIKVQITNLKHLELHHVSPALTSAANLSLTVPGTYKPSSKEITIQSFSPSIGVIASKQRPRRMSMLGSDGNNYQFLLKGHEDLRQDERVMQLFGLINICLDNDRITNNRGLSIVRYSVLPLSNNSGVIGWVENCDTINQLVKQYREAKEIRLLIEVKLLQAKSLNYDKLPLVNKVELFRQVLEETTGQDLAKMLWLKSKTSDVWVERRANFTKSLAVMSMVGYILGLGDRHPSNLMVDRVSGGVVHIDFGDCFEITSQRSKYPEIIPFRLTRMLTNCMDPSGIEGTFRLTCERVMRVLRENKDSVMAMLEAFVYDPLISWRLLANRESSKAEVKVVRASSIDDTNHDISPVDQMREHIVPHLEGGDQELTMADISPKRVTGPSSMIDRTALRRLSGVPESANEDEPLQENLNARALEVINRIQAKLTGRDFAKSDESEDLTVDQQVDRLIKEATSVENLCQLFTGWCPLW